jgi:hypothetical protein
MNRLSQNLMVMAGSIQIWLLEMHIPHALSLEDKEHNSCLYLMKCSSRAEY